MQKNTLVSIIIPVYNGSNYMREAIDSALCQTYENCEVIVINDGSTDNGETERIALSYGDAIRYYRKKNGGVSSALNLGIKVMHGNYFSWLSHDDVYKKNKIMKQVEVLNRNQIKDAIVLSEYNAIDKNSRVIKIAKKRRTLPTYTICNWTEVLLDLTKNGAVNGCGFLIPKHMLVECNGFREDLRFSQDYLMWIQLFMNKNPLIYIDEELVSLRIHDNQLTQKGRALYHKEAVLIAKEIVPQLCELSSREKNFLYYYAKDNVRYNSPEILEYCFEMADKNKLFTIFQKEYLKIYLIYGKIRPVIRRIYYQIFRKIKTQ